MMNKTMYRANHSLDTVSPTEVVGETAKTVTYRAGGKEYTEKKECDSHSWHGSELEAVEELLQRHRLIMERLAQQISYHAKKQQEIIEKHKK